MIELISIIAATGSSIMGIIQSVKRIDKERKEIISTFLVKIADTIDEAAEDLSNDIMPNGTCQMMQEFAVSLPTILKGISTRQTLLDLSDEMYRAYNIESLYQLNQTDKSYIDELRKAAGKFRAAAIMIDVV